MNTTGRRSWMMRLAGALFTVPLFAGSALAQQTFVIAGFGGPNEALMRKSLIPEFEKKHNVKVEWLPASSTQNHGRIKAQKANPQVDVILLDHMVQVLASKEDLLAPLDSKLVPNLAGQTLLSAADISCRGTICGFSLLSVSREHRHGGC